MAEEKQARVALVTGASQGIGAATALAFAREGCDVAVTSTRLDKLDPLVGRLSESGRRVLPIELDVRSPDSVASALAAVFEQFGQVDVLVNNAAIPLRRTVLDMTLAEWEDVMRTNLTGTFLMCQHVGRRLIERGQPGCIVNITSSFALIGMAGRSAYGVSKAAVNHLTRMLAIEWAGHGIRVNAIVPGRVDTESRAGSYADPAYIQAARDRVPLRRFAQPDEVAAAACYLAGPHAGYITGQMLVLDGGLTIY